jgi:sigma-B regulation protein RsbU (phosphoserine phosphatase)
MPDPPLATRAFELRPGDTLILYSDGLTESRTTTPGSPRYGTDALLAYVQGLAPTTAPAAVAALAALLDSFGPVTDDDVAIMALGVSSPFSAAGRRSDTPEPSAPE